MTRLFKELLLRFGRRRRHEVHFHVPDEMYSHD
jgi:hypothetical protein